MSFSLQSTRTRAIEPPQNIGTNKRPQRIYAEATYWRKSGLFEAIQATNGMP
jgi:hypothetical protein